MNTNELRETTINVMSKAIVNSNPKMVIRRLQDDNAFVIYANINGIDTITPTQYTILIDIVTEKTKPDFSRLLRK